MPLTIGQMTTAIRDNNIRLGWRRPEGGPGDNTLGDYLFLMAEEIGEVCSDYRRFRLADITDNSHVNAAGLPNPKGVPSEFADLLIRLLDMADVFGLPIDPGFELADLGNLDPTVSDPALPPLTTFGDHMAWLCRRIDRIWTRPYAAPVALNALVTIARKYGIDLEAEFLRKHAYNCTREYRHGGALAEPVGA